MDRTRGVGSVFVMFGQFVAAGGLGGVRQRQVVWTWCRLTVVAVRFEWRSSPPARIG